MYKVIFSRFRSYSEMREIFARKAEYFCEIREIFERDRKYFRDTGDFAKDTGNISASRDLFVCCVSLVPVSRAGVLCINMSAVHNIDNSLEVSTHSTDSSCSIHGDLLLVTVSGGLDSRYTDLY